jgi:hypothetical protein
VVETALIVLGVVVLLLIVAVIIAAMRQIDSGRR